MAKSADEARKAAMSKKPAVKAKGALPKGGGKGLSGDALVGNVSPSTIKDIKRMGMTAALKLAGTNGKTSGGVAREFQEGVRRMYGADRLAAAKAKYGPAKATSPDAARGASKPVKPVAKSADAARLAALQKSRGQNMPYKAASTGSKPVQKDMYGNKAKASVTVSSPKKKASSSKKSGYKAPTQKDMYGNKIK